MPGPDRKSYTQLRKRMNRLKRTRSKRFNSVSPPKPQSSGPIRQGTSSHKQPPKTRGNPTGTSPGMTLRKRGLRIFEDGSSRKVKMPRMLNKVSSGLGYKNWKSRKPRIE